MLAPLTLAEEPASARARTAIVAASVAYAAFIALVIPVSHTPGPPLPAVSTAFATGLAVTEGCTFWMMVSQALVSRSRPVLWLAIAYLFSALMAVTHLATFPGAIVPSGPLIGAPRAVGWLVITWQLGFPCLVIGAILATRAPPLGDDARRVAARHCLAAAACVVALVIGLVAAAPYLPDEYLPTAAGRWTQIGRLASWLAVAAGIGALALSWMVLRGRTMLFLWLSMSLVAFAANTILATVAGGRYTLGWYAGRASLLVSGSILLLVYLAWFARQNRVLAATTEELERTAASLRSEMARREEAEANLRQANKLEAIGQLTAGVAHDFNNLLAAIIGSLDVLQSRTDRGARDDLTHQLLATARAGAERGARLTRYLLAFGRKQVLQLEALDLNGVLRAMEDMLRRTVGPLARVELRLGDGPWRATADRSQLELVVLNLCINARDAMPAGGTITIETSNLAAGSSALPDGLAPGDYVALAVSDTGTGMSPEVLAKCLDPFFTTKEVGQGSGLGLPMVYGVATQGGGTVAIRSALGEGTTVRVFLPRAAAREVDPATAETAAPDRAPTRVRTLLVDDDEDLRPILAIQLRILGCDVTEAPDAAAAMRLLRHGDPFGLLVADYAMPAMTGLELARAARSLRPDLRILLVTGYAGDRPDAGRDVDCTWLSKPFRQDELARAVRATLGQAKEVAR